MVHLLEVMVHDNEEDEEISAEEEAAVARSKEWFLNNEGIPFEQVVSDLGFTMDQIRGGVTGQQSGRAGVEEGGAARQLCVLADYAEEAE